MGGGGQVNSAQANAAAIQSGAASTASAALSNTQNSEQQKSYNYLFGDPTAAGSTGSLTNYLNPALLNVTQPTGAYKTAYNLGTDTLAQNYDQQRGSLSQAWANKGFTGSSTPTGFLADQMRKLGNSQADSQGSLFTGTVGQQYQDALNNFWNANNISAGQSATLAGTSDAASKDSGTTANGVYQTAGAAAPSVLGSALGAVGTTGTAATAAIACPARGAKIATERGDLAVEELKKGDKIYQSDRRYFELSAKPKKVLSRCLQVFTTRRSSTVSVSHCFSTPLGGYTEAASAVGKRVSVHGARREAVYAVKDAGEQEVFIMPPGGNNTYLCDGIWSLI
jgi:hypothetical protein